MKKIKQELEDGSASKMTTFHVNFCLYIHIHKYAKARAWVHTHKHGDTQVLVCAKYAHQD